MAPDVAQLAIVLAASVTVGAALAVAAVLVAIEVGDGRWARIRELPPV